MSSEIEIITLPVGQMQANCHLVFEKKSGHGIIIDPGDDADYIERIIADKQINPSLIISTHAHFDHIMAVMEVKLAYDIQFKINCNDKFLALNMRSSAKHFISLDPGPPPEIDGCLKEGDVIKIGNSTFKIIETPGHTPGSICLYSKEKNILFTGDTLFADGGIGRTDFSYSNPDQIQKSLKKIFSFPPNTQILPGHGRPSTLEEESQYHL